jgi:hypothetical protein
LVALLDRTDDDGPKIASAEQRSGLLKIPDSNRGALFLSGLGIDVDLTRLKRNLDFLLNAVITIRTSYMAQGSHLRGAGEKNHFKGSFVNKFPRNSGGPANRNLLKIWGKGAWPGLDKKSRI